MTGATDQGSVAGLHSQLLTAPLLEAITEPPPSDNTSDDGPAFTDDVEVVSREGPNDDSENREPLISADDREAVLDRMKRDSNIFHNYFCIYNHSNIKNHRESS